MKIPGIVAVMLWMLAVQVATGWGVEVGEPLPDFTLDAFDGQHYSAAALEGKPALLVFWNTWCPNCKRELPEINRLAEQFGPKGLVVLAINTAINDSEDKARAYWKEYGYAFPAGFDYGFEVRQAFRVLGVPTIFLIDSKGVVRYKQSRVPVDMEEQLERLILDK